MISVIIINVAISWGYGTNMILTKFLKENEKKLK